MQTSRERIYLANNYRLVISLEPIFEMQIYQTHNREMRNFTMQTYQTPTSQGPIFQVVHSLLQSIIKVPFGLMALIRLLLEQSSTIHQRI
jgi:hypothetical protein